MDKLQELLGLDVNGYASKKQGLTYLSWANAWKEFLKVFPLASYEIKKNDNGLPVFGDSNLGYMCYTTVTVGELTHEMWLPVMDFKNKAMLNPSMFDINKTVMRCLTKNLAMFGLGLYIYAGEDLPEDNTPVDPKEQVTQTTSNIVRAYLSHDKLSVDKKISTLKEQLNKKEILPNQYLVDELIKEYGSLENLNA